MSEGAVLNTRGTLLVDCGSLSVDSVRVWNDDTEWTPQAIYGRVQQYNITSDGSFTIRTSVGNILLSFRVTIPQDFVLYQYFAGTGADSGVPGRLIQEYGYRQVREFSKREALGNWIRSTGDPIEDLPLFATNNAIMTHGPKSAQYGSDYVHYQIDTSDCIVGQPLSIYVGNVLVCYIEQITA